MNKYDFLRKLHPIGILFEPYSSNIIPIRNAPKLWLDQKYSTKKGYHYYVSCVSNEEISIQLENVCPYENIVFNPVKLEIKDFTDKIFNAISEGINYISLYVKVKNSYECSECLRKNYGCKYIKTYNPEVLELKIYFDENEIRKVIDLFNNFDDTPKPTISNNTGMAISYTTQNNMIQRKGEKSMTNLTQPNNTSLFGINAKFGIVDDPNIAATALGICFKNEAGNWINFNKETRQRTDMGNLQLGNLPLYMIPSTYVEIGDSILYEEEYYYVMDTSNYPKLTLLSVKDGIEKTVYPSKSILGFDFFTKIVALIDADTLLSGDDNDLGIVLMLSSMGGQKVDQNQLLPLLLLGKNSSPLGNIFGGSDEDPMSKMMPLLMLNSFSGNSTNGSMDMMSMMLLSKLMNKKKTKSKPIDVEENTSNNLTDQLANLLDSLKPKAETKSIEEKPNFTFDDIKKYIDEKLAEKATEKNDEADK